MLLEVESIDSFYGDFQALFGVSVEVAEGETLAIIGANGAGKSTLLANIAGLLRPVAGRIRFDGVVLDEVPTHRRVALGISLVPEGRRVFASLSVLENLQVGAYRQRPGSWTIEAVFDLFPLLRELSHRSAAVLSGGEQQTLAIGRARLRDYMKNMYQGVEVCIGNPSIKPYDLQYVADDRHGMYGLAGVRGIVDIMSFRDGYITVVEPDCCVYGTDRDDLKVWGWCTSFAKEEYGRRRVEQRQVEDYKMWRSAMGASVINELYGNASWRIPAQLAAAGIVAPYAAGFTEAASKYLFNFAVKSF